jgi:hypothetical protein
MKQHTPFNCVPCNSVTCLIPLEETISTEMCESCGVLPFTHETDDMVKVCDKCWEEAKASDPDVAERAARIAGRVVVEIHSKWYKSAKIQEAAVAAIIREELSK